MLVIGQLRVHWVTWRDVGTGRSSVGLPAASARSRLGLLKKSLRGCEVPEAILALWELIMNQDPKKIKNRRLNRIKAIATRRKLSKLDKSEQDPLSHGSSHPLSDERIDNTEGQMRDESATG